MKREIPGSGGGKEADRIGNTPPLLDLVAVERGAKWTGRLGAIALLACIAGALLPTTGTFAVLGRGALVLLGVALFFALRSLKDTSRAVAGLAHEQRAISEGLAERK